MSDTIRWCYTHKLEPLLGHLCCERVSDPENCDVVDALVIRADQPVYRIDEEHIEALGIDYNDDGSPNYPYAAEYLHHLKEAGVLVRIGTET